MPNKYKDLVVHEVSLVDKGANKRKFALLKSDDLHVKKDDEGSPSDTTNEPSEDINMTEEEMKALIQTQVDSALEAQAATLAVEKDEAIKKAAEEASSNLDTELQKRDNLIEVLRKAEDERSTEVYLTKAEGLSDLGLDREFGLVLKAVAAALPEEAAKIEDALFKAADTIKNAPLLKEEGHSADVVAGAESALDLAANELRAADPTLSGPQAVAKALDINPGLYDEYLAGGAQ